VKLYHQATSPEGEEGEAPAEAPPPPAAKGAFNPVTGRDMVKIYVGAGRLANIRPQDLVGAIANEGGIAGGLIGAIQITDRFSLVEVPEELAEQVIKGLGKSNIRGKKVQVRRDGGFPARGEASPFPVRSREGSSPPRKRK
jgi:ATP-dependent RNA helicase DeaD